MDEKGDEALGLDDEPGEESGGQEEEHSEKAETEENAADAPIPYPIGNAGWVPMASGGRQQGLKAAASMADKPAQKTSLKEKLETFKMKADGKDADNTMPKKAKDKAETL